MDTRFQADEASAMAMNQANVENNWPQTKAPQQFTQYPVDSPYTNPPLTIPLVEKPPQGPPIMVPPPGDADAKAAAGTGNNADFRTDLSQYNLVVVKDKDVPNTAGYNPRAKLMFYPKGKLPGSNETFYLVTHAFADKAGISEVHRGYVNIKSDALGRPTYPLMAYLNDLGLPRNKAEKQDATGGAASSSALTYANTVILSVLLVILLMILYNLQKKQKK